MPVKAEEEEEAAAAEDGQNGLLLFLTLSHASNYTIL